MAALDGRHQRLVICLQGDVQHALGLAAADGQQSVGRHARQALAVLVIDLVLGLGIGRVGHLGALKGGAGEEPLARGRAGIGVLGDHLGGDVPSACQGVLDGGDLVVQIVGGVHARLPAGDLLLQEHIGQGLQPFFAGHHRAGAALGLER